MTEKETKNEESTS